MAPKNAQSAGSLGVLVVAPRGRLDSTQVCNGTIVIVVVVVVVATAVGTLALLVRAVAKK